MRLIVFDGFKKAEEDYVELIKKYWKTYENEYYELCIEYPCDENHKPIEEADPQKELGFTVIPKDRVIYPNISFTIEKNDDNIHSYVRVFINFVRAVFFEDMKNEQDEWLDAYETVFELNKLIRNLFPGYTILSDEEIASRK